MDWPRTMCLKSEGEGVPSIPDALRASFARLTCLCVNIFMLFATVVMKATLLLIVCCIELPDWYFPRVAVS